MDLIQKTSKLGYKHYTEFTVKELDNLSLGNSNKQIEYYFIQKWLRDIYKISVEVTSSWWDSDKIEWEYNIYKKSLSDDSPCSLPIFKTYEEALEEGLYQALKLI